MRTFDKRHFYRGCGQIAEGFARGNLGAYEVKGSFYQVLILRFTNQDGHCSKKKTNELDLCVNNGTQTPSGTIIQINI